MPRPCKRRRICGMPKASGFAPSGCAPTCIEHVAVIMTLDEFETIRLIDYENMTQEECAASMDVARTTVQAIYNNARKKTARALCDGLELKIQGGDYVLCEGKKGGCKCRRCMKGE